MALRNITNKLLLSWYQLLNGHISVNVYRGSAPPNENGNYVLLRAESETFSPNSNTLVTNPVIITEIVTKHHNVIDDGVVNDIDDEIAQLAITGPGLTGLTNQTGINITNVRRQNATDVQEDDGNKLIHRLITRNLHRVVQT